MNFIVTTLFIINIVREISVHNMKPYKEIL
jgi:hypothetical protein